MKNEERREMPRAEVDLSCTVRQRDGTELTVRLIDLTCLGGGFVHTGPLPLHATLLLRFTLPIEQRWHAFTVTAKVIHNYPAIVIAGQQRMTGCVVGIDFETLGSADRTVLCAYIAAMLHDGGGAHI